MLSMSVLVCQAIDIRLGLAIDSPKATLAVKRSLACEMVKCWQQVGIIIDSFLSISGYFASSIWIMIFVYMSEFCLCLKMPGICTVHLRMKHNIIS
uniref:Uncharacterized protein n=1 Tax=Aegilops tauschii subsp. strangulata TaxID=200361 RepID=A0A453S3X5_AEGTS